MNRLPTLHPPPVSRNDEGEDGAIRAWTADRGKLCGARRFSAFLDSEEHDKALEDSRRASLDDRMDHAEGTGAAGTKSAGDVPVPVCSLASCGTQPVFAVGLCHGAVHIIHVKQVFERVARGARDLNAHPTERPVFGCLAMSAGLLPEVLIKYGNRVALDVRRFHDEEVIIGRIGDKGKTLCKACGYTRHTLIPTETFDPINDNVVRFYGHERVPAISNFPYLRIMC